MSDRVSESVHRPGKRVGLASRLKSRTDGRTDGLTKKNSPIDESCSFVTRALSLKDFTESERLQNPVWASRLLVTTLGPPAPGRSLLPWLGRYAQGFPGRPLIRQTLTRPTNCNNSASRRVQVRFPGTQRNRSIRAACSPLAGWHDKACGSNPLRPPTSISAANRLRQYDCVCVLTIASLPLAGDKTAHEAAPAGGFLLPKRSVTA